MKHFQLNVILTLLLVLFGSTQLLLAQSKQLHYGGFSCDIYGSRDQTPKVMDNDAYNLSYDFNVTELGPGSYVAVFHAEPYRKEAGCAGDSVAVRYSNSPDGYFGNREGNCPNCPGDHVITRTQNPSHMMYSNECGGYNGLSGGGNPILIKRQGDPEWTLFYLSVSDYTEAIEAKSGQWRHYLMVAHPSDVTQMTTSNWATLARNGDRADYWHWFNGTAPKWQSYQPWPARVQSSGRLLQSAFETPSQDTQGLIGNMSYDESRSTIHYFYLDIVNGQNATIRQEMANLTDVNWWRDPTVIRNDWIEASFHNGRKKWAVFSNCNNGEGVDICLQFTANADVNSINQLPPADPNIHGLGLGAQFNDHRTGGIMEQFGYLKNHYGQIPGDDFRVYVSERSPNGAAEGLYDMDMFSVRVNCHCDTGECNGICCDAGQVCSNGSCCAPNCNGKQCGSDGCGGSCGSCDGNSSCDDLGQCIDGGSSNGGSNNAGSSNGGSSNGGSNNGGSNNGSSNNAGSSNAGSSNAGSSNAGTNNADSSNAGDQSNVNAGDNTNHTNPDNQNTIENDLNEVEDQEANQEGETTVSTCQTGSQNMMMLWFILIALILFKSHFNRKST